MNQLRRLHVTFPGQADQIAWLGRLVGAPTPQAVGELVVELARNSVACRDARLLWLEQDECRATDGCPDARARAWMLPLLRGEHGGAAPLGGAHAIRLAPDLPALLLMMPDGEVADGWPGTALEPCLGLAGRQLRQLLALGELHDSHRQLARSENLQRALFAISDLAGADLDMPELLRGIHGIVGTLMYAENFYIVRHDPERGTVRFLYYADTADTACPDIARDEPLEALHGSLTWHLLVHGYSLMGSAEQLAAQIGEPLEVVGPDSVDWLGVPMLREGRTHGALVVQSYRDGIGYSFEDRAVLGFVAEHVLTALERKQSKDELERRVLRRTRELASANRELQQEVLERQRAERLQSVLFRLAELGTADLDEDAFYRRVHAEVGSLLDASNFYIALLDGQRQQLDFPYYVDAGELSAFSMPLERTLTAYVLRTGRPWMGGLRELEGMVATGEVVPRHIGTPATCWLGVPLRAGEAVIGVVAVQGYGDEMCFGAADQELLGFAALQIANSIHRRHAAAALQQAKLQLEHRVEERTRELREQIAEREQVQRQLRHEVMHDPLTGLPNRGFLRERLGERLARNPSSLPCALLYLDVDRFKVINDSLGHLAGDAFLQETARRLHACVCAPDVVARLAGDEFAILLDAVASSAAAERMAQDVLQALHQPLSIGGRELEPSASVGIAVSDGRHGCADSLLRDADIALYRAKQLGRGCYVMFDDTLARNVVDELALEGELRHALAHGEFAPHYQPIFRLDTGEVVGHEALLRWNHPRRGMLLPDDFTRIAQDCGQLEAIDWQMFGQVCERMAGPDAGAGFVTINVSPQHLRHAYFDRRLLQLLERSGLPPTRLLIELTEGALLEDPVLVRGTLERLRAAGVQTALDDFGTGYSSLSYLHSLPLGKLKIDQVFVRELDSAGGTGANTVVAAVLALARALGIGVIAEGIETAAQRDALRAMGCEFGQGFLLGRPAPAPCRPGAGAGAAGAA
ncbi:EAL domain-containing protein [Rhodanobacter sp. PCA2]|uniref:bifunctional diguanylate cyclase/phosphodiesterase n=1 Tax=Rhodanobacter sp. PCA2 TaxID=2006117 RepID=UPI0015E702D7|nr:EAL domain-containing protein [Rhodanobacter sp. PCA2]MBA2079469.1 bifunctional diguanylate cyclase/phosphodiesterase [Rhodanobacter sp. PCA2]